MRCGDNRAYAAAAFDDSSWKEVDLPGNLMPDVEKMGGGNAGILWLRKTFSVDRSVSREDIGLILGRIAHADEVFFNGEKIGGMGDFPPREHSMWNHPRHYQVPRSIIRFGGDNVIAVRLAYHLYGEVLGTIGLANMGQWKQNWVLSNFFFIILSYLFIAAGFPLFLIFLYFMIKRYDSREYLYYCLQLICVFFIILDGCNYWNLYGSLIVRFKVFGLAWASMVTLHQRFLQRIYRLKPNGFEWVFRLYFVISVTFALLFLNEDNLRPVAVVFICLSMLLGLYNIVVNVVMVIKRKSRLKLFTVFDIIGMLGAMHDGALYFMRVAWIPYPRYFPQWMIFHYTIALLIIAVAIVLVSRFYHVMGQMKDLASSVENVSVQNTILHQRLRESDGPRRRMAAPAAINERTDRRIEQVLGYIKENFTEDISREGLAAMVDIHPDTLGRFFKIYVNMRIGDYINVLRIKAAADRLVDSDANIITIAFDVGFDSVRTFNRVFKKIKGMSPEEYRKCGKTRDKVPVGLSQDTMIG